MSIATKFLRSTAVLLALAGWCVHAGAAGPGTSGGPGASAGQVQFVTGSAQLTTETGKTRLLRKGDPVNEGDTLTTAPAGALQVKMRDGGIVAMRPDSRVKIDTFKFTGKQDGTEQSNFSLLKGGFRAVTGLIGRVNKQNYRVNTPTATIGIRGTDHEIFVVLPGSPLASVAPAGTYNKVNTGETVMSNEKGEVAIKPNQMGFAAAGQAPQLQPLNLDIFTAVPAPQAKGGGQGEKMRDNAVVDGGGYEQGAGGALDMPPYVIFSRIPITATYQTPGAITCTIACFQGPPVTNTVTF